MTFLDTGSPSMFNRYMYGNNDPVNMLDPDGRQSVLFGVEVDAVPGVGGAAASGGFTSKLPDGTKVEGRFFQERISVGRDGGASFTASRIMGGDIDNMVGLSTSLEIDGVTGPYGSQGSLEFGMTAGEQTFGLEVGVGVGEGDPWSYSNSCFHS